MPGVTSTDLCNRALSLLGDKPINELTDDSQRAVLCLQHYEPTVQDCLQEHDWNFASKRVELVQRAEGPTWGFAFAFALPTDYVRVRATSLDAAELGDGEPWQIELLEDNTAVLVTNTSVVSIRYTARQSEGLWRPTFATAVVYELSARLAYPITGRDSKVEMQSKLARGRIALAKAIDGQEGAPRSYVTTALIRDRF